MLKRMLAVAALGSLAGCVVGPGPGNGYYSQGYYDQSQGYAQQPGYYDQGYGAQPAYPAYGPAPVYAAPAYGVIEIGGGSGGRGDSRDRPPPRQDGRWQHDDNHGRPAPQGGYGGGPRPQGNQPQAQPQSRPQGGNGGRDPNWRGPNGGGGNWNGNAQPQQNNGGGRRNAGTARENELH